MGIKDDLTKEVTGIFTGGRWREEKANVIPSPKDLLLNSNHAKEIESATVLYADIDGSTNMVDKFKWWFAAEVYKAYLRCAGQLIRSEGGDITAYDGDRVMAVFTGERHRSRAVIAALRINWAVENVINPAIKGKYASVEFTLKHVIGIDTSGLYVSRIGVHGDNDLVWIGRAANHAAKLCAVKP
jgi:class 3 adenylate cyclase